MPESMPLPSTMSPVTKRRRASLRARLLAVVSATVLLTTLSSAWVTPASAADDASLRTTITGVSPSVLGKSSTVTLSGEVTNAGDSPWTDAQAYLVIPRQPQTDVEGLADSIRSNPGYAGPRVVSIGQFDEIGDLAPGDTRSFRVSVPGDELPIEPVDGVYPVGVQILATDDQGERSVDSVSRAVTLLPRMTGDHAKAPATVVWPFVMPVARDAQGALVDVDALVESIGAEGQLRHLLDAATAQNPASRGVAIDPALVLAVDDLAEGRDDRVDDADRRTAAAFRDDLIALAADPSSRTLDFDRTDVLALSRDGERGARLLDVSDDATSSAIERFGLSANRLSWPTSGDADADLLSMLAGGPDRQLLLDADNLPDWEPRLGPALRAETPDGTQNLIVEDDVTDGLPGAETAVTLRQRVLASGALASLDRDGDSSSRSAALAVVDPTWDPGPDDVMNPVPAVDFVDPTSLDELRTGVYAGDVEVTGDADPIPASLTRAVDRALDESMILAAAANDGRAVDAARARSVASLLGVRWRGMADAGVEVAQALAAGFRDDIAAITVMGPGSVTLSSSQGAFPLTISNGSRESVSVGVQLLTSNPALDLPDQDPVEIAAGERLTLTVDVDLAQQNATIVTAQLLTPDGEPFGEASEFNVRSSSVGVVLWVTMGAAGVFVLFALTRRFRKRSSSDGAADE